MFISADEYKKIEDASFSTEVLWCCRFEYVNDGKLIEVVSGWRRRNFVTTSGRSQEGSWFCTICEDVQPLCVHILSARSILALKVKENIEEIFFNTGEDSHLRTDPKKLAQIINWVFRKALNDEPMGQKYEQYIPVALIEELLDMKRYDDVFVEALRSLEENGTLVVQEGVLVDHQEAKLEMEYWKLKTGHHELRINDYGGWACSHCMKFSSEPNASRVECTQAKVDEWIQIDDSKPLGRQEGDD